jgi:hypothetical protein
MVITAAYALKPLRVSEDASQVRRILQVGPPRTPEGPTGLSWGTFSELSESFTAPAELPILHAAIKDVLCCRLNA